MKFKRVLMPVCVLAGTWFALEFLKNYKELIERDKEDKEEDDDYSFEEDETGLDEELDDIFKMSQAGVDSEAE